ncbi:MAG: DUF1207 domain-containing protein [Longimicrobiales bacterium]
MRRISGLMLACGLACLGNPVPALSQQAEPWCFSGVPSGELNGTVFLPEGDLFCPLLADPKAEHSFVSYLKGDFPPFEGDAPTGKLSIGAVGLGDAFPLVRWTGGAPGNGLQIGLVGGIFAQFNLDTESFDLINADYLVGIPVTFRRAGFSTRLRVYHQSSHLGDEFILGTDIERKNLSFESVDLLLSQELGPFRAYGGGEFLFNREPETLESTLAHAGMELRLGQLRGIRFLGAVDLKATEQHDWDPGWSARAGIEIAAWRDETHPPRLWGLFAEYYDGPSPYGQFFQEQVKYLGVGLHLSF